MPRTDGWADWGEPRQPRQPVRLHGVQEHRYCARCDAQTVWARDDQLGLLACPCGMTAATELNLDELDNLRRHYRLTRSELDDMVGLPQPARI